MHRPQLLGCCWPIELYDCSYHVVLCWGCDRRVWLNGDTQGSNFVHLEGPAGSLWLGWAGLQTARLLRLVPQFWQDEARPWLEATLILDLASSQARPWLEAK